MPLGFHAQGVVSEHPNACALQMPRLTEAAPSVVYRLYLRAEVISTRPT